MRGHNGLVDEWRRAGGMLVARATSVAMHDCARFGRPRDRALEPELNDALVGHARNNKARARAGLAGIQDEQRLRCRGSNSTAHRSA